MAEIKLPREKGSTIVDDDGKIWTLRGKKRNRGIAPKGYEFYRKADATVGMRRAGVRQQATEFERSLKGLTPEQREQSISIRQGRAGRAGVIKAPGAGGGSIVPLSIDPTDPEAQVVNVTVKKPGDVKTIREMGEKVAGLPAARFQDLVDQTEQITDLYEKLNETVKVTEKGVETVRPRHGVKGNEFIQKQINLLTLKYQRDADTDGILTAGGPGLPGTRSNPYKPVSEIEMKYLEPMDYYRDPEGKLWQWVIDGVTSPELMYAERERYMWENPRPRPKPPKEDLKARAAGMRMPEKHKKPTAAEKSPKTMAELMRQIAGITKTLNDPKKLPPDRTGVTRERLKKRLAKLQKQHDEMMK